MIDSKDISVVVQGAINKKEAKRCINSIKKYLPNAEIILSTWEGSDTSGLKYDKLLLNKDPGAVIFDCKLNRANNINRQLVSTQEGIKLARRKYILKLRTDFYLKGTDFLYYFDKFPMRNPRYSIFQNRIIVPSAYSRLYTEVSSYPLLFHPSDFWFFGKNEDIKSYFLDTPLMPDCDAANYKCKNFPQYFNLTWRYAPEQYYCLSFVKRHFNINGFEDWSDFSFENKKLSDNILLNNFIFLDVAASNIYSKKHEMPLLNYQMPGIITYKKFAEMYLEIDAQSKKEILYPVKYKANKYYCKLKYILKSKVISNIISCAASFIFYFILNIINKFNKNAFSKKEKILPNRSKTDIEYDIHI